MKTLQNRFAATLMIFSFLITQVVVPGASLMPQVVYAEEESVQETSVISEDIVIDIVDEDNTIDTTHGDEEGQLSDSETAGVVTDEETPYTTEPESTEASTTSIDVSSHGQQLVPKASVIGGMLPFSPFGNVNVGKVADDGKAILTGQEIISLNESTSTTPINESTSTPTVNDPYVSLPDTTPEFNQCFDVITEGGTRPYVAIGDSYGADEKTVEQIALQFGYVIDQSADQKPYTNWKLAPNSQVVFEITLMGREADYRHVYGYYTAGLAETTFAPLGKTGNHITMDIGFVPIGGTSLLTLEGGAHIGFAIKSFENSIHYRGLHATQQSQNSDGSTHNAVVYKVHDGYIIGFEDLPANGPRDNDYNDVVLLVRPIACGDNTPAPTTVDLSVTKTASVATTTLNTPFTYTISVTNHGPATATGVSVTDTLPTGISFISATSTTGTYATSTGIWTVGTLAKDATATLTLSVKGTTVGEKVNTAGAISTQTDTNTDNNTDTAVVTVIKKSTPPPPPAPTTVDLSVTKTASVATTTLNTPFTYTISVTNHGPATATGVSVTDTLPTGISFISATSTTGTYATSTGIWTVGTLAKDATATLTLSVKGTTVGEKVNTAGAISTQTDTNTDNNTDTAVVTVIKKSTPPPPPAPTTVDLSVTKTASVATTTLNTPFTYTISVTNHGPATATGVSVTDTLPTGISFISATSTTGTYATSTGIWTVGTLAKDATATLTLSVKGTTVGEKVNTAGAISTQTDTNTDNNTDTAVVTVIKKSTPPPPPAPTTVDLSVTKTASVATTTLNTPFTYTISVTNHGPATATGVSVTDTLPTGISFISATSTTGTYATSTGIWTVGTLAKDATATLTLSVKGTTVGEKVNTAGAISTQTDTNTDNNTDTAVVTVIKKSTPPPPPAPTTVDLSVTKTASVATTTLNTPFTYTISVTNHGPATATGVSVTDTLPTGISFISATSTTGTYATSTGIWTVGTLAKDATATLTLSVKGTTVGEKVNTAGAISTQTDTNTDNNTDTAVVTVIKKSTPPPPPAPTTVDLSVTKTASVATTTLNTPFTYTISVTNHGPATATGVSVTDTLPTGISFISATSTTGTYATSTGIWTVGTLAKDATATLTLSVKGTTVGEKVNTAGAISTQTDTNTDNNTDTAVVTVIKKSTPPPPPAPTTVDLSVTKTASVATTTLNTPFTYTISVTNHGPATATGVSVTDTLPTGISFISATSTTGTYATSTGIWTVGTLAKDATATLTLSVKGTTVGEKVNTAGAISTQTDTNTDNNTDTAVVTVIKKSTPPPPPAPTTVDLSVTKTASVATTTLNTPFTYTISVTNHGPATATGVSVTDTLPTGISFISATSTTGTYATSTGMWTIGTMTASQTETLHITVTASTTGTFSNTATATSTGGQTDNNPDNDSDTVDVIIEDNGGTGGGETGIDLSVSKTASVTEVDTIGVEFTYTISVKNLGPDVAEGVEVTDVLPAGLAFVSATTTTGSYATSTSLWTVGDMIPNATETLTMTVSVTSIDTAIVNVATATSTGGQTDNNPDNDTATSTVTIKTGNGGGGTGDGGGGRSSGGSSSGGGTISVPQVPVAPQCEYLKEFLRLGYNNNPIEVIKLQSFLNAFENENLVVDGFFDLATDRAVRRFQVKYFNDILEPWGHTDSTGYVYILTKKKVNEIFCQRAFPVTESEANEIVAFRAFLESLRARGVDTTPFEGGIGGDPGVDVAIGDEDDLEVPTTTDRIRDFFAGIFGSDDRETTTTTVSDTENRGAVREALRNVAAAAFVFPGDMGDAMGCLFVLLIILAIIYVLGTVIVNGMSENKPVEVIRRRKVIAFMIGVVIALAIAFLVPYPCLILPLTITLIILVIWYVVRRKQDGPQPMNKEFTL